MKQYTYERAEKVAGQKPPKPRLEYNLIPKKMAEHMANGYQLIN